MSREEARRQLAGSFRFELHGGNVLVRDESLLDEIKLMTAESVGYQVPHNQASTGMVPSAAARYVAGV